MNKKSIGIIALIVLVSIVATVIQKATHKPPPQVTLSQKVTTIREEIVPVRVESLGTQPFTAVIQTVATVKAKEDYILSAKSAGEISMLNADLGQPVRKGQVLAKINPEMAEASLRQAQANYDMVESSYIRQKQLAAKNLISDTQLEAAKTQFTVAQSTLKLASIGLKYASVISPINGVVAEKYVELYAFVAPGRSVVRVVNPAVVEIEVGLSEKNVGRINKGNAAELRITSLPGKVFTGKVVQVGLQGNQDNKTFPVRVLFSNPGALMKGGMIGDLRIRSTTYPSAVVVPFDMVQKSTDGTAYVFVLSGEKAVKRSVIVGDVLEDRARIESGLVSGDMIIVDGYKFVSDGTSVSVKE
jgi:membrane fusion protein (multidrug efflux system)